jgi:Transposase, Mutator family
MSRCFRSVPRRHYCKVRGNQRVVSRAEVIAIGVAADGRCVMLGCDLRDTTSIVVGPLKRRDGHGHTPLERAVTRPMRAAPRQRASARRLTASRATAALSYDHLQRATAGLRGHLRLMITDCRADASPDWGQPPGLLEPDHAMRPRRITDAAQGPAAGTPRSEKRPPSRTHRARDGLRGAAALVGLHRRGEGGGTLVDVDHGVRSEVQVQAEDGAIPRSLGAYRGVHRRLVGARQQRDGQAVTALQHRCVVVDGVAPSLQDRHPPAAGRGPGGVAAPYACRSAPDPTAGDD